VPCPARIGSLQRLWRYYQAGIVNTAFGYGLYALFVTAGFNMYVAQISAHVIGVAFNYLTYSRYAFRDSRGSKSRFIFSYAVNYLMGLASLATAAQFIRSPYVAGAIAVLFLSFVNYFILKHFVFFRQRSA